MSEYLVDVHPPKDTSSELPEGHPYRLDSYGRMAVVNENGEVVDKDRVSPEERVKRAQKLDSTEELYRNFERMGELNPDDRLKVLRAMDTAHEEAALLGERHASFAHASDLLREGLERASEESERPLDGNVPGPIEVGEYYPVSSGSYARHDRSDTSGMTVESRRYAPMEATGLFQSMRRELELDDYPSEQMEREEIEPLTAQEKVIAELIIDFGYSMAVQASKEGQPLDGNVLLGKGAEAMLTEVLIGDPSLIGDPEFHYLQEKDQREVIARTFKGLRERAMQHLNSKGRSSFGLAA